MVSRRALQAAESTVRVIRSQAERVVACEDPIGRAAAERLQRLLRDADRLLGERLRRVMVATGGQDVRFSAAQASMYREQVRLTSEYVQARLAGMTDEQARAAIASSLGHTVDAVSHLEEAFTGIAQPLRLRQALVFDNVARGVQSSLLRQHLTSVDRYGASMIGEIEQTMATGMVAGFTQWDMVNALTGFAGPRGQVSMSARVVNGRVERLAEEEIPEGLFTRYRSWAWRIVRTETSHAYNEARLAGLIEMRAEMPDLAKKILATFDQRTAYDSIVVHGQIRPLDGLFTDGLGRQYQRPPGRPNDREVLIPWRSRWPETPSTAPLTPAQVVDLRSKLGTPQVRGVMRDHDVAEERRLLGETRRARQRTQAAERRRAREQGLVVQEIQTPGEPHAETEADRNARREVRRTRPRGPTRAEQAAARAAERERERERKALFDAEASRALEVSPSGTTVRWHGENVGDIESVGGRHVGLLRFEDPADTQSLSGYRYVRSPPQRSRRAAAEWVARQRWEAEEEVRAARPAAPDPVGLRRSRLESVGLGHLAGDRRPAFTSRDEALGYLRAVYRAEAVTVVGEAEVALDDLTVIADRLDNLPAHQTEFLYRRGTRVRIMPRDVGVGRDPTWGGGTQTFDGRPWANVEGAYSRLDDTVRVEPGRVAREVMRSDRSEVVAHEMGHALSQQTGYRMSSHVEFQRILTEEGGRDALRQHAGWYVSDATSNSLEESFAEGYALANTERGRQWLERNSPALLRYYERLQETFARYESVEMNGWSVSSSVLTTRRDFEAQDRARTLRGMIGRTEAREVERVLAQRFPRPPPTPP